MDTDVAPRDVTHVTVDRLEPTEVAEVSDLLDRVTEHDGLRPLSEHVWLHVKEGGEEQGLHVLSRDPEGALIGYAHLDITDEVEGASAELMVDPGHRRRGIGTGLIKHLQAITPDPRLRLWAHGGQGGAGDLAARMGFRRARSLWQMRRSLYAPLPRVALPEGVEIRPFRPGVDEDAWLTANARAFPHLPDQGSWSRADLDRRLREPWFSPEGFLLAWREGRLVGFHWTKVHGGDLRGHTHDDGHAHPHDDPHEHTHAHQHAPIGEVYVVGVDPDERGSGLGRALTLAGLHHLRTLDLDQAMLYVDAVNAPAIALYEGLGFARWDTDVMYQR